MPARPALPLLLASILPSLCVAACASGGGANSTAPSITASPALRVPTPSVPDASVALGTLDAAFIAASAVAFGTVAFGRDASGQLSLRPFPTAPNIGRSNGALTAYYRDGDRIEVEPNGFGYWVFGPGDRLAPTVQFDRYTQGASSIPTSLAIARAGTPYRLTYTALGTFTQLASTPPAEAGEAYGEVYVFALGSPTLPGEMPRSGLATYMGVADGLWFDGASTRRLYGSAAALTADFASGQITSTLDLSGRAEPFGDFASAPSTRLGVFQGAGDIRSGGASFSGDFTPTAGYTGGFVGTFNGPAAGEVGVSFTLRNGVASVIGAAVARTDP